MLKKLFVCLSLFLLSLNAFASAKSNCPSIKTVKPSDNLTTFEINPSINVINDKGGVSLSQITAKYYYSFANHYSLGVELPFSRFEQPNNSVNGLGDLLLSIGYKSGEGFLSFGSVWEFTLPSATQDELSLNKVQISPSLFGVVTFSNNVFMALGYKHYATIAGPSDAPDVNMGRVRGMVAYKDNKNWYVVFEPQYYINYKNAHQMEFICELEIGTMLRENVLTYIKTGKHVSGNMDSKDWTVSLGMKFWDF